MTIKPPLPLGEPERIARLNKVYESIRPVRPIPVYSVEDATSPDVSIWGFVSAVLFVAILVLAVLGLGYSAQFIPTDSSLYRKRYTAPYEDRIEKVSSEFDRVLKDRGR